MKNSILIKLNYFLIIINIIVSLFLCINFKSIIPVGYELAIDGIVFSKTLTIIYFLYSISKLNYFILNSNKNKQ